MGTEKVPEKEENTDHDFSVQENEENKKLFKKKLFVLPNKMDVLEKRIDAIETRLDNIENSISLLNFMLESHIYHSQVCGSEMTTSQAPKMNLLGTIPALVPLPNKRA